MAKRRNPRAADDVITIVRDVDELHEILVRWDDDENPIVKATYLVPDPDGTLRLETRTSAVDPAAFADEVFEDTK